MMYEYYLIWRSQYGNEEIACFETREEAERMQEACQVAFSEGDILIALRRRRQ